MAKDMMGKEAEGEEKKDEPSPLSKENVNSYKIGAMATMLDDFENILAKNFCQFANK